MVLLLDPKGSWCLIRKTVSQLVSPWTSSQHRPNSASTTAQLLNSCNILTIQTIPANTAIEANTANTANAAILGYFILF